MHFFCHKKNLRTFFVAKTIYAFFCRKTIYALRPESFCALKFAIRKVQTFWASAHRLLFVSNNISIIISERPFLVGKIIHVRQREFSNL